jgi:hypothetical protein
MGFIPEICGKKFILIGLLFIAIFFEIIHLQNRERKAIENEDFKELFLVLKKM